MPTLLDYDTFPPGSDLSWEFLEDGVRIAFEGQAPGERAIRQGRLLAAMVSLWGCACVTGGVGLVGVILLPTARIRANLSPMVYVLMGVFAGAVYLLDWKRRNDEVQGRIETAHRGQTVLTATSRSLTVDGRAVYGEKGLHIDAADIRDIRCSRRSPVGWYRMVPRTVEVMLKDGAIVRLLPWRDEAELGIVVRMVRRAIRFPEGVGEG